MGNIIIRLTIGGNWAEGEIPQVYKVSHLMLEKIDGRFELADFKPTPGTEWRRLKFNCSLCGCPVEEVEKGITSELGRLKIYSHLAVIAGGEIARLNLLDEKCARRIKELFQR